MKAQVIAQSRTGDHSLDAPACRSASRRVCGATVNNLTYSAIVSVSNRGWGTLDAEYVDDRFSCRCARLCGACRRRPGTSGLRSKNFTPSGDTPNYFTNEAARFLPGRRTRLPTIGPRSTRWPRQRHRRARRRRGLMPGGTAARSAGYPRARLGKPRAAIRRNRRDRAAAEARPSPGDAGERASPGWPHEGPVTNGRRTREDDNRKAGQVDDAACQGRAARPRLRRAAFRA